MTECSIVHNDNLDTLGQIQDGTFDLVYMDPPFNTGKTQKIHGKSYVDSRAGFLAWFEIRLREVIRTIKPYGSLFVHLDWREVHYVKVMLDGILGRENFQNEIIWAYDYGGRSKRVWSRKHDSILWYTKNHLDYVFNFDAMDRIPYMAPGLVGKEKAARGKTPTDVWWHTIVPTNGKERLGYPTQKPLGVLQRIVNVHSKEGDLLMDPFAGSGTFGEAALIAGRHALLIDENEQAIAVMEKRLARFSPEVIR
jgi:site-specific DNA-methyltransferase (adenine-specific)